MYTSTPDLESADFPRVLPREWDVPSLQDRKSDLIQQLEALQKREQQARAAAIRAQSDFDQMESQLTIFRQNCATELAQVTAQVEPELARLREHGEKLHRYLNDNLKKRQMDLTDAEKILAQSKLKIILKHNHYEDKVFDLCSLLKEIFLTNESDLEQRKANKQLLLRHFTISKNIKADKLTFFETGYNKLFDKLPLVPKSTPEERADGSYHETRDGHYALENERKGFNAYWLARIQQKLDYYKGMVAKAEEKLSTINKRLKTPSAAQILATRQNEELAQKQFALNEKHRETQGLNTQLQELLQQKAHMEDELTKFDESIHFYSRVGQEYERYAKHVQKYKNVETALEQFPSTVLAAERNNEAHTFQTQISDLKILFKQLVKQVRQLNPLPDLNSILETLGACRPKHCAFDPLPFTQLSDECEQIKNNFSYLLHNGNNCIRKFQENILKKQVQLLQLNQEALSRRLDSFQPEVIIGPDFHRIMETEIAPEIETYHQSWEQLNRQKAELQLKLGQELGPELVECFAKIDKLHTELPQKQQKLLERAPDYRDIAVAKNNLIEETRNRLQQYLTDRDRHYAFRDRWAQRWKNFLAFFNFPFVTEKQKRHDFVHHLLGIVQVFERKLLADPANLLINIQDGIHNFAPRRRNHPASLQFVLTLLQRKWSNFTEDFEITAERQKTNANTLNPGFRNAEEFFHHQRAVTPFYAPPRRPPELPLSAEASSCSEATENDVRSQSSQGPI